MKKNYTKKFYHKYTPNIYLKNVLVYLIVVIKYLKK